MRGLHNDAFSAKQYDASKAITASLMEQYGMFEATQDGIDFSLPAIAGSVGRRLRGREACFINGSSGYTTFSSADGEFVGGLEQFCLGPLESALVECNRTATAGHQFVVSGMKMPVADKSHTATLAWTTGTPGAGTITKEFLYTYKDGIVIFRGRVSTTDGKGATQLTISLPKTPYYAAAKIPIRATKFIDGTPTDALAYIAADQATAANRVLTFADFGPWPDTKACSVEFSGWYPVRDFTSWTPTLVWGTADPASITTVAKYKVVDGIVFAYYQSSSADNNACSSLTVSLPENVPPDTDVYPAVSALALSNTTYTNPYGFIDCANATEASRVLGFSGFPACTDSQAVAMAAAMCYEIDGGVDWSDRVNAVWSTGTPASVTAVARYKVIDGQWCWFTAYLTSADSNGATELVMDAPMVALKQASRVQLNSYVLNNATNVYPSAYIAADEDDGADRKIIFDLFPACTDGNTVTVRVTGMFRVAG